MLDQAGLLVRRGAADNHVGETRCDLRGEVVDVDRFACFQSPSQTLLDEFVDRFGKAGHNARCLVPLRLYGCPDVRLSISCPLLNLAHERLEPQGALID
jgi:hypothetical protein